MNNIHWSLPFLFSAFCLIPLAILAVIFIWRTKDVQAGLRLFLLPAVFVIFVVFFTWLLVNFLPKNIQDLLLRVASIASLGFILISGCLYWLNITKGGKLIAINTDSLDRWYITVGVICLLLGMVELVSRISGVTAMTMLFAVQYLSKRFFVFQIREKGIISQGRFTKFEDIQAMKWVDLRNKEKVDIILKDTNQLRQIKIPWKLIIPVDDYIKKNFSTT